RKLADNLWFKPAYDSFSGTWFAAFQFYVKHIGHPERTAFNSYKDPVQFGLLAFNGGINLKFSFGIFAQNQGQFIITHKPKFVKFAVYLGYIQAVGKFPLNVIELLNFAAFFVPDPENL